MVARPPTSAVEGRKTTPARRSDGLLLILAAETRALRPTVFTAASNFERTSIDCDWALRVAAARDTFVGSDDFLSLGKIARTVVERADTPGSDNSESTTTVRDATRDEFVRGAPVDFSPETGFSKLVFDGTTRDADAPNADGAHKTNAKKHVANLLISWVNYIIFEYWCK